MLEIYRITYKNIYKNDGAYKVETKFVLSFGDFSSLSEKVLEK